MADKKQIQNQKEYNSLLGLTQSMLGKISGAMDNLDKATDKRNKKLSSTISLTSDVVKQVKSEKDLQAAIGLIRSNNAKASKEDFGINNKLKQEFFNQASALEGVLKKHNQISKVFDAVGDIANEVKAELGGVFDGFDSKLKGIPIVGKALSNVFQPFKDKSERIINVVTSRFLSNFKTTFLNTQAQGMTMAESLNAGLTSGFASATKHAKMFLKLLGPIGIAIALIGAGLAIGVSRLKELEQSAKNFRNETGLLNSQTEQLKGNIQTVSRNMAGLGVSAEDVSKAASEFTKEFQGLEQPSEAVLSSMVMLNKNFGISTSEATKLNKVFQNIGGLTAEQSQALIGQTVSMAKIAGVAPSQVIDDMAKSSEIAYKYFQGSPQELAKAAVAAAKLGTSIEEAGKVADGLLDFQSSISSELKAQAMLGTNLNFAQARYLAANGDILGSQQAIIDQVQKNVDLTNLNTYEQQALAEATGMQFSSLQNQVRIRERFGKLNKEQLAAANALVDAGRDISQLTESDLKAQTERMGRQQEMQSMFDELGNTVNSVKVAFTDMFAPIASTVMPIFVSLVKLVGGALATAFRGIASVISFILTPVQLIADGFKTAFDMINNSINALKVFVGTFGILLAYKERGLIIDKVTIGLQKAKTVAETVYGAAVKAANLIKKKGLLSAIAEMAMRAFSSLSAIPIVGPVLGIAGAAAAAALGYSYFSKAGDIRSEARGKTQVSTKEGALYELSGNDDFAAGPGILDAIDTQGSPQVALSGAGNVDLSPILGGLQELGSRLEMAFSQNKDVYMDNTLVTAKVTTTQDKSGRTNSFGINKG